MCLTVKKRSCIQTAKKDIIAYKVLLSNGHNEIISPYENFKYKLSKLYRLNDSLSKECDNSIEKGYHSFVTNKGVKKELKFWYTLSCTDDFNAKVFKCIIPKGSKYYVGTYDDNKSYCSDQIIILEELK